MLLSKYPGTFALIEPVLRGKKILDLGCNCGYHLQSVGPGSLGLDYDSELLGRAQSQNTQAVFARADFNSPYLPLAEESFDVVLASHVLEHVHAPIKFLGECNRVLAGGGYLILGLPVEDGLYARLALNYFGHPGHIYSFSLTNIRKLLTLSGFSEIKFVYHLARIGFRTWWNNRFNQWVNAYLPGGLSYHMSATYWVIARKRQDYEQIHDRVVGVFR
jgi:SAM-dependent methyltransferase